MKTPVNRTETGPDAVLPHRLFDLGAPGRGPTDHPPPPRPRRVYITKQNQPAGYKAESQRCLQIMDRFPDVPSEPERPAAHETELAKDRMPSGAETAGGGTADTPLLGV